MLYSDFDTFARDQELVISAENTFDYVEGLVLVNKTGLIHNWRSSFNPQDPVKASRFISDQRTLFCLELTKNFNPENADEIDQVRGIVEMSARTQFHKLAARDETSTFAFSHNTLNCLIPKLKC